MAKEHHRHFWRCSDCQYMSVFFISDLNQIFLIDYPQSIFQVIRFDPCVCLAILIVSLIHISCYGNDIDPKSRTSSLKQTKMEGNEICLLIYYMDMWSHSAGFIKIMRPCQRWRRLSCSILFHALPNRFPVCKCELYISLKVTDV